jgi:hypothetical protein
MDDATRKSLESVQGTRLALAVARAQDWRAIVTADQKKSHAELASKYSQAVADRLAADLPQLNPDPAAERERREKIGQGYPASPSNAPLEVETRWRDYRLSKNIDDRRAVQEPPLALVLAEIGRRLSRRLLNQADFEAVIADSALDYAPGRMDPGLAESWARRTDRLFQEGIARTAQTFKELDEGGR